MSDITPLLAYGPDHHAVETVMRLHSVKRWHMIDTTRTQTLAEHSANVALLAMMIAATAPVEVFDTYTLVAAAALVHDIPEAFTGDMPSHVKKIGDFKKVMGQIEAQVTLPVFEVPVKASTRLLIKLCDLGDGIRFIRLHGVDGTARHAREGLEAQYCEKVNEAHSKWPTAAFVHVRNSIQFYAYEAS